MKTTLLILVLMIMFLLTGCGSPDPHRVNAVVIGDSIANQIFQSEELQKRTRYDWSNAGIPGQIAEQVWARWDKDVRSKNPEMAVLMIGTNNVERETGLESLKETYLKMFNDLEYHGTRVFVLNLGPNTTPAGLTNDVNEWLSKEIPKHNRFTLIDFHSMDMNNDNSYDGIHLRVAGSQIVVGMIMGEL